MTTTYGGNQIFTQLGDIESTNIVNSGEIESVGDIATESTIGTSAVLTKAILINQVEAPNAPIATLPADPTPGNCDNGDWAFKVVFVDALGNKTEGGTISNTATIVDKTVRGQINIINISTSGNLGLIQAREIYASLNSGDFKYAVIINDNTTEIYTFNMAEADLGAALYDVNTTGAAVFNGPVRFKGGVGYDVIEIDQDYQVTKNNSVIVVTDASAHFPVNVILPLNAEQGFEVLVPDLYGIAGGDGYYIDPGTNTINGVAGLLFVNYAYASYDLIFDGTSNWSIFTAIPQNLSPSGDPAFRNLSLSGQLSEHQGTNTASATDVRLPTDGNSWNITGGTTIERISSSISSGGIITLLIANNTTIKNGIPFGTGGGGFFYCTLLLDASSDQFFTAGSTVQFIKDGTGQNLIQTPRIA